MGWSYWDIVILHSDVQTFLYFRIHSACETDVLSLVPFHTACGSDGAKPRRSPSMIDDAAPGALIVQVSLSAACSPIYGQHICHESKSNCTTQGMGCGVQLSAGATETKRHSAQHSQRPRQPS